MKRKFVSVLHILNYKDYNKVVNLSGKVSAAIAANTSTFGNPSPALASLNTETATLKTLIADAMTGNHQKVQARNEQCLKVLNMLHMLATFVSNIAAGDRAVILLSGFDASNEPSPHSVPDKVAIKRITDGKTEHSAKIMVVTAGKGVMYTVQVAKGTDLVKNWQIVLQTTNSRQLILEDLVRGAEISVRVSAMNSYGMGEWSEVHAFLPR
jgi:hypothetical protein